MQEFKITEEAIKNIVTILAELPFRNTAHLMSVGTNGSVGLNGVTPIAPVEKSVKVKGGKDG